MLLWCYKPIFHQNAKYLASGTFASPNARIPTCWYILRQVTPISCVGHVHFIFFVYISFALGGQRKPHFQWNIGGFGSSGVGHVYFMYISYCLCIIFRVGYVNISRRKGIFQWNMGFNVLFLKGVGVPPPTRTLTLGTPLQLQLRSGSRPLRSSPSVWLALRLNNLGS